GRRAGPPWSPEAARRRVLLTEAPVVAAPALFELTQQKLRQPEVPARFERSKIVRQRLPVLPYRFLRTIQGEQRVSKIVARVGVLRAALQDLPITFRRFLEQLALLRKQRQIVADLDRIGSEAQRLAVVV